MAGHAHCEQANGAACTTDGNCLASSICDGSAGCTGANLRMACSPATGLDAVQCYGRCTAYCSSPPVTAETALFNRGAAQPCDPGPCHLHADRYMPTCSLSSMTCCSTPDLGSVQTSRQCAVLCSMHHVS